MRVVPSVYYKCIHFRLEELVPKPVFDKLGEKCWWLFDSRLLYTADCIWEFFNTIKKTPIICNDYLWGGSHQYRGFRPSDCDIGAEFSGHKRGSVLDSVSPVFSAKFMREKIIENNRLFPYISRIEDDVDWLHVETTNVPGNSIILFKP